MAGASVPAPIARGRSGSPTAAAAGLLPQVQVSRAILLLGLGVVAIASLGFLVWGILGDLPYAPDVDEPDFLRAAIRMPALGTLNPDWFGHPGSTIIYPIAALSEVWYLLAGHLPPFAHPMHGIATEFAANPTPFYLIGRFVSLAYGFGCVAATWLLARRLVGDAGAILAALIVLPVPVFVQHAQLVRTDTAGAFFALIALWLAIRAMDGTRMRDWVVAAVAIGLAVSTRWFYVVLVVPYAIAALTWWSDRSRIDGSSRGTRRSWAGPIVAILAAPVTFMVTSPALLLHLRQALSDLRIEARSVQPGADGLSPVGNLQWYLTAVLPWVLGSLGVVLAVLGVVVLVRADRRRTSVLIGFALSYLVGVSASPLHWTRYVIPLIPIFAIFVVAGALSIGAMVARAVERRSAPDDRAHDGDGASSGSGRLVLGTAAILVLAAIVPNVITAATVDHLRAGPTTRVAATEWIKANLPPTARIAQESYAAYLDDRGGAVTNVFALALAPFDSYRSRGTRYLITSSAMGDRFADASRYPSETAFYQRLAEDSRLMASFEPTEDRGGPTIRVYDLGP